MSYQKPTQPWNVKMMREANESYTQFLKKQMLYSLKHMIYCNKYSSSISHSIVEYDLFVVNHPKYYPLNCYFFVSHWRLYPLLYKNQNLMFLRIEVEWNIVFSITRTRLANYIIKDIDSFSRATSLLNLCVSGCTSSC